MLAGVRRAALLTGALLLVLPGAMAQTDLRVVFDEVSEPVHPTLGELQVRGEVWIPCASVPAADGDPRNGVTVSFEVTPHPWFREADTYPADLQVSRVPDCNLEGYTLEEFYLRGRLHAWAPALNTSEIEVTARLDDLKGAGRATFQPAYYAFLQMAAVRPAVQSDPGGQEDVPIRAWVQTNGPTRLDLRVDHTPTGWQARVPETDALPVLEPVKSPLGVPHTFMMELTAPAVSAYAQSSDLALVRGVARHATEATLTDGVAVASVVASVRSGDLVVQLADAPVPGVASTGALVALAASAVTLRRAR